MKTFSTILKTELKLSLRGMDMVIFALCMPLVVLVILWMIYGSKPAFEGAAYTFIDQSLGGIAAIAICAGGLMGLPLVVSDYRGKGILKRFHVTPVSPVMILVVQAAVYTLYALASLVTVLITAAVFFKFELRGSALQFVLGWLLVLISMFSIGMLVGGIAKNSKQAGIIASILYFPMLIFSGTTIPYEVMPKSMQRVVDVLPMTQGIKLLKAAVLGLPTGEMTIPVIILAVIALACTAAAIKLFRWE